MYKCYCAWRVISQGKKSEKMAEQDVCSSCCTHMATILSRSCPTSKPSMQTWSEAWGRRKERTYLITEHASVEDTLGSRYKKSRGLGRPPEGMRDTRDGEPCGRVPRVPRDWGHGWGDTWCEGADETAEACACCRCCLWRAPQQALAEQQGARWGLPLHPLARVRLLSLHGLRGTAVTEPGHCALPLACSQPISGARWVSPMKVSHGRLKT